MGNALCGPCAKNAGPNHLYKFGIKTPPSLNPIVNFGTICTDNHTGTRASNMGCIVNQLLSGMIKISKKNLALKKIPIIIPNGNINLAISFHVHEDGFNLEVRHEVMNPSIHNHRIRAFLADKLIVMHGGEVALVLLITGGATCGKIVLHVAKALRSWDAANQQLME